MTLAHELHHEAISQAVAAIETTSGIYTNEIVDATGLHKEIITNWLKANNFQKTGGHMSRHWQRCEA